MSSINSNAGFFNAENSSIVPLIAGDIFDGVYSSCLNYSVIEVSVKCDTIFDLNIVYSPDSVNDEFTETITVSVISNDTLFYKFEPKMRYFKLQLLNTDTNDQTVLSLQCLQKSTLVYSTSGIGSDVNIVGPLNNDGSVFVGGNLALTGSVDANITNTSLDVNVLNPVNSVDANITNTSLDVNVLNPVNSVDVNNFPAVQDISITDITTTNNLNVNVNGINSSFVDNGGLKVSVVNASSIPISGSVSVSNFPATQAVSNGSLSSMSFDTNQLKVLDTDANTKLTNIYNIVNSRGQAQMLNGTTFTAVELPNVKSCAIYGSVSGATILTVKFSPNGVDFYSSQYSVNMTGAGDFGFVIAGLCAKWIMLSNSNNVNGVAFVDYC